MTVAQHGISTKHGINIIGYRQQHTGKKVEKAIHHMKQPQLSVRGSMVESLNEEMFFKDVFLQLVPVTSCSELKRRATQGCVCTVCGG